MLSGSLAAVRNTFDGVTCLLLITSFLCPPLAVDCSFPSFQLHTRSESALSVVQCHPGYTFDMDDKACVCRDTELGVDFVRCDQNHRYFYVMVC